MKINEIINEASWSDVINAYKTQASINKTDQQAQWADFKKKLTPFAGTAEKIARARIDQLADQLVDRWQKEVATSGNLTIPQYQYKLATWLGDQLKGRVSSMGVQEVVDSDDPQKVREYLTNYLLPDKFRVKRPDTSSDSTPTGAPTA